MRPHIERTNFGSITIDEKCYEHDVVIRLSGAVEKRKKKLSKDVFGTSHMISREEARHVCEEGASRIIIGSGQNGMVELSDEARAYFRDAHCSLDIVRTPDAIEAWNHATGNVVGLFHVTC